MATRADNSRRIKTQMADALLQLMREKPYEDITINELTARAGVGRVSYFRHFGSKEEILVFKYLLLCDEWVRTHDLTAGEDHCHVRLVQAFFEFHYHHRDILLLLRAAGLKETVAIASYRALMAAGNAPDSPAQHYRSCFFACGLSGVLAAWVERDFDLTLEQMVAMCKTA